MQCPTTNAIYPITFENSDFRIGGWHIDRWIQDKENCPEDEIEFWQPCYDKVLHCFRHLFLLHRLAAIWKGHRYRTSDAFKNRYQGFCSCSHCVRYGYGWNPLHD